MQKQIDNESNNILDTMFREFNNHDFYGLEFIIDELYRDKELNNSNGIISNDIDWYGLIPP